MPTFIVPALNEGEAIALTVDTICKTLESLTIEDYQIILIDDGSTDDSGQIVDRLAAANPKIVPVHNETNLGLGVSVRKGIQLAEKSKFLVVPGDNDVAPDSLRLLLSCKDAADLVLTVPLNKEVRPHARQIVSWIYQTLHNVFFSTSVSYINGPGVWPTALAKEIELKSNRFSIISEMNVKLLTKGVVFTEIPIYLQVDEVERATVTWRNFVEVVKIFVMLLVEYYIKSPRKKIINPKRIKLNFAVVQ